MSIPALCVTLLLFALRPDATSLDVASLAPDENQRPDPCFGSLLPRALDPSSADKDERPDPTLAVTLAGLNRIIRRLTQDSLE